MVNTTQFYKTKIALAVVLSIGLSACGDSEGDAGSTTTSTSVADSLVEAVDNTIEQGQGTGSVQGTVLDTNGLAVMGATVSLAGQSVETDASGYYFLEGIPLPGVDGVNSDEGSDTDIDNASYNVTITGPEGYASAIVTVQAEDIQVDSGNNGSAAGNGDTNNNGEQTTWFDGFLAQAQTANLPAYTAAVTGVLRNCNTGAALAGVKVAFDFNSVIASTIPGGNNTGNGTNVSVGVPAFVALTDEDGRFSFDALPTDSDLSLAVEGYAAANASTTEATVLNVTTDLEAIVNNIGDVSVCAITSSDNVAPFINSVDSVITANTSEGYKWGVLSEGKDGTEGITLRFNEALDVASINVDDLIVTTQVDFNNLIAGEKIVSIASAAVADDGMSMTLILADALPVKTKFSVWMPRYQYTDVAAVPNTIITGDAVAPEFDSVMAADNLVFDVAGTSTGGSAAVPAVPAVTASFEFVLDVGTSVNFTAVTAGTAGNTLTLDVTDSGSGGVTTVAVTGTGITVDIDVANSDADDLVAAITGSLAASAVMSAAVDGVGTAIFTTLTAATLANGAEIVAEVAEVPATAAGATGSSEFGIDSDTINSTSFKSEYVRTRLCTFVPPVTDPGVIVGEQLVKTTIAADDAIDAVGVFWDNGGTSTISNLNGQHDQTQDLLQELWNRKNTTSAQTIIDDTAVVTGDLNDATSIVATAPKATLASVSVNTTASTWTVVVEDATHLDEVTVTPTAAFNIIGTPITVVLEDKVAPTTVIQDSYNYADSFGDAYVNAVAADAGYANGGELSQIGTSGSEGSPILYVTPRLFATDELNDDDGNFNNRVDVFRSLAEGNTLNDATTPEPHVTSTTNFVYDVNAFADWAPVSATVGVAFSENVELVTGQAVGFALANSAPSTTLTGFVANNGLRNEDYLSTGTDKNGYHTYLKHGLIQMTSNDVVGLANMDHNSVLDYTGAVTDTVNANDALSDALVIIADAIPPFVVRAELDATTMVVTFNEAITTTTGTLTVVDPDQGVADFGLDITDATASVGNTVFTWTVTDGLPTRAMFSSTSTVDFDETDLDSALTFGGSPELESIDGNFAYAETAAGSVLNHALLTWSNVNDANGNNWGEYRALFVDAVGTDSIIDTENDGVTSTNGWRLALRDIPVYLATDTIAAFEVGVVIAVTHAEAGRATPAIDNLFTVTLTSSHPLDVDADQWNGSSPIVGGFVEAEILSNFRIVDTSTDASTDCAAANLVAVDSNDSGGAPDAADFCAAVMTSVTGSFNADNTELSLTWTQTADTIQQASTWEFQKISTGLSDNTDWAARLGHVVSTIDDNNSENQSQNVKRGF
jgi:hypothetical protein